MAVSQAIQEQVLKEAYSATPNYDIDPNDPRFSKVEEDKSQALTDLELTYGGMIGKANGFYQDQIDNLEKWEDKQIALKDEQFAFEEQKINQQKEQAHKDYLKEQSASYVDWQKQSNKYGANAEQMASAGLTGTGFSESSQVSMYNTYQMRVASARESFERAKLNYDNLITEARLENNAAKAQIAFETLQKSLELSLEGFQYENQLLLDKANKKIELKNMYHNQYMDVLQQINTENALKEDIRQYNETQKWNTEQADKNREHDEAMAEIEYNYQAQLDEAERTFKADQAILDREHELAVIDAKSTAEQDIIDKQWAVEKERLTEEHNNAIKLLEKQKELAQQSIGIVSGGSKTGSGAASAAVKGVKTAATVKNSTTKSSQPPINYKSLNDLGYSGISASRLAELVNKGVLVGYVKNGELHFRHGVMQKNPAILTRQKIKG